MNFHLAIVSMEGEIFSGEVSELTLPTLEGEAVILAKHMPYVTPVTTGEVTIKTASGLTSYSIGKGVFVTSESKATLLIEDVTASNEISEIKALEAQEVARELLQKGLSGEEKLQTLYALRKSLVDLKIARKRKKITTHI